MPRRLLISLILGVYFVILSTFFLGFRWNMSPSFPIGIWKITGKFNLQQDMGKVVIFNPKGWYEFYGDGLRMGWTGKPLPLMKRVVAKAGDQIDISKEGVRINNELLPNSIPIFRDSKRNTLPIAESTTLSKGMIWVMSDNQKGFDSRYFGPISEELIIGVATPIQVWRKK